jgi:hypothetical protein
LDVLGGLIVTAIVIVATRPLLPTCNALAAEPASKRVKQSNLSPAGEPQTGAVATA